MFFDCSDEALRADAQREATNRVAREIRRQTDKLLMNDALNDAYRRTNPIQPDEDRSYTPSSYGHAGGANGWTAAVIAMLIGGAIICAAIAFSYQPFAPF